MSHRKKACVKVSGSPKHRKPELKYQTPAHLGDDWLAGSPRKRAASSMADDDSKPEAPTAPGSSAEGIRNKAWAGQQKKLRSSSPGNATCHNFWSLGGLADSVVGSVLPSLLAFHVLLGGVAEQEKPVSFLWCMQ